MKKWMNWRPVLILCLDLYDCVNVCIFAPQTTDTNRQNSFRSIVYFSLPLIRLGRVSFRQVLNLLDYATNETETAPLTEALSQLSSVYRLLDKRQEQTLVARMKVNACIHTHIHTRLSGTLFWSLVPPFGTHWLCFHFVMCVSGVHLGSFWPADGQSGLGRGGECVQTGAEVSPARDGL